MAACCGKLAMFIKIHDILSSALDSDLSPLAGLDCALNTGHLDIVNYIMDYSKDRPITNTLEINRVRDTILNMELLERLMAHPNIKCTFKDVLSDAINARNIEVIDMILFNSRFNIDCQGALDTALFLSDFDTARKIIGKFNPTWMEDLFSTNGLCGLITKFCEPGGTIKSITNK
ncbi:hypothetical protein SAMD00019534_004090 [Acytostelium subglobosum LB1]|uniref:hypothetical protein n=1 Tax=Acytostelium subglobosum LB1 TaxID=1410327 RepID=UPI000644B839|nr:hypothetical protein SAMD00019534_004090 [Acytostelium subglobosum LB1]GAM17234.1 hypothetical protein SAMD00019534_004090 [Acytostelium subglobosum LB1]|eukprot:XP_012759296.1 hypothetical protein SAMD00019534_004090 [Acytostelium subglobosum LB1]